MFVRRGSNIKVHVAVCVGIVFQVAALREEGPSAHYEGWIEVQLSHFCHALGLGVGSSGGLFLM